MVRFISFCLSTAPGGCRRKLPTCLFIGALALFSGIHAQAQSAAPCSGKAFVATSDDKDSCTTVKLSVPAGYSCKATLDSSCGRGECKFNTKVYDGSKLAFDKTVEDPNGGDEGIWGAKIKITSSTVKLCTSLQKAKGGEGACLTPSGTKKDCKDATARIVLSVLSKPIPTVNPSVTVTAKPDKTPDPTVRPTPRQTPTPKPTVATRPTSTPRPTATPRATSTPQIVAAPSVDVGGLYLNANCLPGTTEAKLVGVAQSKDRSNKTLKLEWSTNCPNGSFNNSSIARPVLYFSPAANGPATSSCKVELKATDVAGRSSSDSAIVVAKSCSVDCKAVINGSAKNDKCGVCQGDGKSCAGCNLTNIQVKRKNLETRASRNRNTLFVAVNLARRSLIKSKELNQLSKLDEVIQLADESYRNSWNVLYSLPEVFTGCAQSNCRQSDVNAALSSYKNSANIFKDKIDYLKPIIPSTDDKTLNLIRRRSALISKEIAKAEKEIAAIASASSKNCLGSSR